MPRAATPPQSWHEGWKGPFFSTSGWLEDAYKPGYVRSDLYFKTDSFRNNIDLLEFSKGTRKERMEYLARLIQSTGCPNAGGSRRNGFDLYKSIYKEAKATSPQDQETLQWIKTNGGSTWSLPNTYQRQL